MVSPPRARVAVLLVVIGGAYSTAIPLLARQAVVGGNVRESTHFRLHNVDPATADVTLTMLEGTHDCMVNNLGWTSSTLSGRRGGPEKTNVYAASAAELGRGVGGIMTSEPRTGRAYIKVRTDMLGSMGVVSHEAGHALHHAQGSWVDQRRTGIWWEPVAQWIKETYQFSDLCASSRAKFKPPTALTEFRPDVVIGNSHRIIVSAGPQGANHYESWPFLTYLTTNPDQVEGLGSDALRQMMVQYKRRSNEDPLHVLERVSKGASVQQLVASYWTRMSFVDIGHPQAQQRYMAVRSRMVARNINVQSSGPGTYTVIPERRPQYFGANIMSLQATGGPINVQLTADAPCIVEMAVRNGRNAVRYHVLPNGSGTLTPAPGDEIALVVVNTPPQLIPYDGYRPPPEATKGLNYSFTLSGATVQGVGGPAGLAAAAGFATRPLTGRDVAFKETGCIRPG